MDRDGGAERWRDKGPETQVPRDRLEVGEGGRPETKRRGETGSEKEMEIETQRDRPGKERHRDRETKYRGRDT